MIPVLIIILAVYLVGVAASFQTLITLFENIPFRSDIIETVLLSWFGIYVIYYYNEYYENRST